MIKKILLVSSNFEDIDMQGSSARLAKGGKTTEESHYPLSLAYLHAVLEKNNFDVKNLFLNNYSDDECFKKVITSIENFQPEAIGFQVLTNNRVSTFRLIEYIHKNFPNIQLIIGGIHATIMYDQIIRKYPFVITVLGEGEITLIELLTELSGKKNLNQVNGIAHYYNGVIKTSPRAPIENLDSLPWPKHEVFFENNKRGTACILTARGCPFNCSFCCLDTISNRRVRFRSIKNVVDEIEWLINKFPQIGKIWIQDDTFFVNNERVIEFCNEVLKRKMKKIGFICVARMKPISPEMVDKLIETNFIKVFLGLESANEKILKKCHKGVTQEDTVRAYELFAKTDIVVKMFLIVGLPGETIETIKETIIFAKKIQKIKYFKKLPCKSRELFLKVYLSLFTIETFKKLYIIK